MKKTLTKKFFTFILLIGGMFSFSMADAQYTCDCSNGLPGVCSADSHGHMKCYRIPHHCGGCTGIEPGASSYLQAYPNPSAGPTVISFSLGQSQNASLRIFDLSGRLVSVIADASFEEGESEIVWNAADIKAGIYFLQLDANGNSETIKLIVTN